MVVDGVLAFDDAVQQLDQLLCLSPQAAPAKTNPAQGKTANIVKSPNGRTYHCRKVGNVPTRGDSRWAFWILCGVLISLAAGQYWVVKKLRWLPRQDLRLRRRRSS